MKTLLEQGRHNSIKSGNAIRRIMLTVMLLAAGQTAAQLHWDDNGKLIASVYTSLTHLSTIPDGKGGYFITYEDRISTDSDIFAQWIDASGNRRWGSSGVSLTVAAGNQEYPAIAADGRGGIFVAWQDAVSEDIYLQHLDGNGTILGPVGGFPVCTASGEQSRVRAVSDGSHGVILVWYDKRSTMSIDLYAQKINYENQPQWQANGVVVTASTGDQHSHTVVSDSLGGVIVTWQDTRNGDNDIYVQRIMSNGTNAWTLDGTIVCDAAGNQLSPVSVFSAGKVIIGWQDCRDDYGDVYSQALDLNGNTLWSADGEAVSQATGTQNYINLTADGAGGAIFAWTDNRIPSSQYDIYAQRISNAGSPLWSSNGIPVYQDGTIQYMPKLVNDGSQGAYIVWNDYRSGVDYDLYCQHISNDGTLLFSSEGIPLCTAYGTQQYHHLISDGSGGCLSVWHDGREGNNRIYTQLINDNLSLASPAASAMLNGNQSNTITWVYRTDSVAFDHLSLHLSLAPEDGFPLEIESAIDPLALNTSWTPNPAHGGQMQLKLVAHDSRDSVICSFTSSVFSVDSRQPAAFDLVSPEQGTSVALTPTFRWKQTSDDLSGLDHYQLWIDDLLFQDAIIDTQFTVPAGRDLSEGIHTWFVKAFDQAGISRKSNQTQPFNAYIDNDPPVPFSLISPEDEYWTGYPIIAFAWEASSDSGSGLANYQLFINNSLYADNIAPDLTSLESSQFSSGHYTWKVIALDSLGNQRSSNERQLHIDINPPQSFTLQTPVNGTWINDLTPHFAWQASADTGIGLAKYQLRVDDQLYVDSISGDDTTITLTPEKALSEGTHSWIIMAVDSFGNSRAASSSFTVNIDTTSPQPFPLFSPAQDSAVASLRPSFDWQESSDASSGIAGYQLLIDGEIILDSLSVPPAILQSDLSEDSHTWQVRAFDTAGNLKNSTTNTFYADTSAPRPFTLLSPAAGETLHTNKPSFQWEKTEDLLSGLSHYELYVDGSLKAGSFACEDTLYTLPDTLGNGTHYWKIMVYDRAGNVRISDHIHFTVDCHPPVITSAGSVTATEDELFNYSTTWEDQDGDDVVISFHDLPSWLATQGNTVSGTPVNGTPDTLFSVVATDPIYSDTLVVSVHVEAVDDAPSISPLADQYIQEDGQLLGIPFTVFDEETPAAQLTVNALSSDTVLVPQDSITFAGSGGNRTVGVSPRANKFGQSQITIYVDDGQHQNSSQFTLTVTAVNDTPFICLMPDVIFPEDSVLRDIPITISDLETLTENLILNVSVADTELFSTQGVTIGGSGQNRTLTLIPRENAFGQTECTVEVSDGELSCTSTFSVTVEAVNDPPKLTSGTLMQVNEHDMITYTATADDPDGPSLKFSFFDYPDWLHPSGTDISGQVPANSADTHFMATVTDGELSDTIMVSIIINQVNDPPWFIYRFPQPLLTGIDSLRYSITLDTYIDDPDDPDSSLTWTWQVLDDYTPTISISGNPRVAEIHGPQFLGMLRISFTATDPHGASATDTLAINSVITEVEDFYSQIPNDFILYSNYPNPFNPSTTIRFGIPRDCRVSLKVYNILGQELSTLVEDKLKAGIHEAMWDAGDNPSGIYFYRLQADEFQKIGRMILLR